MSAHLLFRRPHRPLSHLLTLLLVLALALGACGGGEDDSSRRTRGPGWLTAPEDDVADGADQRRPDPEAPEPKRARTGRPSALLPHDTTPPEGYRMVRARCQAGTTEEPDDFGPTEYFSSITYAVPTAWVDLGMSSAGSGSFMGTDLSLGFTLPSGDTAWVEYTWDRLGRDGEVLDWEGERWRSFDYHSRVGTSATKIVFEPFATVSVADQDLEIFHLDPSQAPKHVSSHEYKARVAVVELPSMAEGPLLQHSAVVTVSFEASTTVADRDVKAVFASLTLPECVWDELLKREEAHLGVDLDGDGKAATLEDLEDTLQG